MKGEDIARVKELIRHLAVDDVVADELSRLVHSSYPGDAAAYVGSDPVWDASDKVRECVYWLRWAIKRWEQVVSDEKEGT